MKRSFAAALAVLFCLQTMAAAMVIDTHCNEEEKESIQNVSGNFEEDYLFVGNELNFSGEAEDLLFVGKTLSFRGKTKLGLIAIGKKLLYSGSSGNGVIAGGMNIVIDGTISGNNYMACKSFQLTEEATIDGNLFLGCAKGSINGTLNGDLYAGSGELVINSAINGNVTAYGGRIIIGEKGKISGNLTYGAKEKLSVEELARIDGTVTIDDKHKFDWEKMSPAKMGKCLWVLLFVGFLVSFLLVGSLLLFLPVFRPLDAPQSEKAFWYTSLWGLIPVLMYPAVVLLCFVLIVTIPFAFIMMFAFVPLFFIAWLIGSTLSGKYIAIKAGWKVRKRHYHFLIGALAGAILSLIPFVNFLAGVFLCTLGWGTYLSFLFGRKLSSTESVSATGSQPVGTEQQS